MKTIPLKCGDIIRSSTHKRLVRVDIVGAGVVVGRALKKNGHPSNVDVVVDRHAITSCQAALLDMRQNR